jgi:hypothetical protein
MRLESYALRIALAIKEAIGRLIRRKPTQSKNADPPDGDVTFWHGGTASGGDPNLFWDNTNKLLGIGTASPQATLDVRSPSALSCNFGAAGGDVNINWIKTASTNFSTFGFFTGSPSTRNYFLSHFNDNTLRISRSSTGNDIVLNNSGNVGIGTTNPQDKLQVAGKILPDSDNVRDLGASNLRWEMRMR